MRHHSLRQNWKITWLKDALVITACMCFGLILLDPYNGIAHGDDNRVSADFLANNTNDRSTIYFYKNDVRDLKHKALILYVRKDGDSLAKIAQSYVIDPADILRLNTIKESDIHPGRIIYIAHTPGIVFTVRDHPLSLRDIASSYDLDLLSLMRSNKQSDPDDVYVPGEPILISDMTTDQWRAMGIIDETRKTAVFFVSRSPLWGWWPMQFTAESRDIISHNPRILKTRVYKFREDNGMIAGFCTYYAAHKATWAFPVINANRRFRGLQGNAIEWYRDAQRKWFKTSKTPSPGALVIYGKWTWWYGYAWHVAYVESVNRAERTMIVSDMNYAWLWTVTRRVVNMDAAMSKSTSDRQVVIGFIPEQNLPKWLQDQYQKIVNKDFVVSDASL